MAKPINVQSASLSLIDTLMKDGDFKTRNSGFVVPSGTTINATTGYTATSSGISLEQFAFQQVYLLWYEVVVDKTCRVQPKITTTSSLVVENTIREHAPVTQIQARNSKRYEFNNFIRPGYVIALAVRDMESQSAGVTTEALNIFINYSYILLPLNYENYNPDNIFVGIGDSITAGQQSATQTKVLSDLYTTWLGRMFKSKWDSGSSLKVVNRGIPGSTAEDIALLSRYGFLPVSDNSKVKVVTVMLGTNQTPTLAAYQSALTEIILAAKRVFPNATIIGLGPIFYPLASSPTYEATLQTYRTWLQGYMASFSSTKMLYFDMSTVITSSNYTTYGLSTTEVHPNNSGNQVMATALLNFMTTNNVVI